MIHKLEADSIFLEFGDRRILTDVYLKCETGQITGLLGRNGQGKTCLMNVIHGTLTASSQSVRFDDVRIIPAFKRPDLLTYLPQFNFMPQNLTINRIFDDFEVPFDDFKQLFTNFDNREKEKLNTLSGGERRLIEVYVLIKSKAVFTLLDEPFSHIMPVHVETIKAVLIEEKQRKGFLITDHNFRHVIDICSEIYVLKDGKTHRTKTLEDIETLGYAHLD
jgi:lipopolysaccharide export system ATP-binding protein